MKWRLRMFLFAMRYVAWRALLLIGRLPIVRGYRTSYMDRRRPQVFEEIYRDDTWRGTESRSGTGSGIAATAILRSQLPAILERYSIRSVLDVPCGDFAWMQLVPMTADYIGADIVASVVAAASASFAGEKRRFVTLDMVRDPLPRVDLIFCRDALVHLSFGDSRRAIANFKRSGATYLMATTFVDRTRNFDIWTGPWRPLNLRLAPFHFPEPLALIRERTPDEPYPDKSMALWRLDDLPSAG